MILFRYKLEALAIVSTLAASILLFTTVPRRAYRILVAVSLASLSAASIERSRNNGKSLENLRREFLSSHKELDKLIEERKAIFSSEVRAILGSQRETTSRITPIVTKLRDLEGRNNDIVRTLENLRTEVERSSEAILLAASREYLDRTLGELSSQIQIGGKELTKLWQKIDIISMSIEDEESRNKDLKKSLEEMNLTIAEIQVSMNSSILEKSQSNLATIEKLGDEFSDRAEKLSESIVRTNRRFEGLREGLRLSRRDLILIQEEMSGKLQDITVRHDTLQKDNESLTVFLNSYQTDYRNKIGDLERRLLNESSNLSKQISLLRDHLIASRGQWELLKGRKESTEALREALKIAEERIVISSPWIREEVVKEIEDDLRQALNRKNLKVTFRWFKSDDVWYQWYEDKWIFRDIKRELYDGIPYLRRRFKKEINNKSIELSCVGTHCKYVICDDKFVVIGSHNSLTSIENPGYKSEPYEAGFKSFDADVIGALIELDNDLMPLRSRVDFSPIADFDRWLYSKIESPDSESML